MTTPFKTAEETAKAYGGKKFKVVRKPSEVWPDGFADSDKYYDGAEVILPTHPVAYRHATAGLPNGKFAIDLSHSTTHLCSWIIPLDCFDLRQYTNDF